MSQRSISRDSLSRLTTNTFSSTNKIRNLASMNSVRSPKLLGRSNSQPQIPTVNEFVKFVTKTDQNWGIGEYKVPRWNAAIESKTTWTFPKEKDKKFINLIEKRARKGPPAPNAYKLPESWKNSLLGNMKGEEKITFISKIFKTEGSKPSPWQYEIRDAKTAKSNILGKIGKVTRMSTTSDAEYLSSVTPSAKYIDIYTKIKKNTTSMPDLKSGLNWKVKKKDGPDPGSYPLKEQALATVVRKVSPSYKQSKGERRFFTTATSKRKDWVPGPGKYDNIDYNKIHRLIGRRR